MKLSLIVVANSHEFGALQSDVKIANKHVSLRMGFRVSRIASKGFRSANYDLFGRKFSSVGCRGTDDGWMLWRAEIAQVGLGTRVFR
jgi:hypothetical protein